ncbi:DUF339-domain-containing protein [Annulohypoxylon maeteangense]|uniref:DUF339-domain-containing protein n=1 Tax=Annulohypoxylon maeteangense TaxID=1927788 RepID=UPI002007304E|nr:DUF339-domain-containing protein [Annulohypoxylon maeteangense]KAI0881693.1 DUF339-domain-containing protein [Annulohypoxylon maeteangense]
MASAASTIPRSILRVAQRPSSVSAARRFLLYRPLSSTSAHRAGIFPGNLPPMEPQKQRGVQTEGDAQVGELEGTDFRIEPIKRVSEDDSTMRARLVYQSRKRGILETDLLLSTFADAHLPTMTREQMTQYDLFLDENDWDIYYWATQEPPSNTVSYDAPSPTSTSTSVPTPSIETQDTSSADYAGGVEAAISEATPLDTSPSSQETSIPTRSTSTVSTPSSSPHHLSETLSTGGTPATGDAGEGKEAAAAASAASEEPYKQQGETGEWAQTVGTFKPAYRPVPERWRGSEVLRLVREHVKARAKERGGMAFMPPLRHP